MKNTFFEYYTIPENRIKEIWEKGIIVLDTCALLNLYRYSTNVRDDLIRVLTQCKTRIWLPYQVGWEYHKNLYNTISEVESSYDVFKKKFLDAKSSFFKILNIKGFRHPKIDFNSVEEKINKSLNKILEEVKGSKDLELDKQELQNLKETIANIFENKIGLDFSNQDLDKLYEDGKKRYEHEIPPGYCDLKNKKDKPNREKYGDIIVWEQIIQESKNQNIDIIFVTGEKKIDWFEQQDDGILSPRKELIQEFRNKTGKDILIYGFADFINKINDILTIEIESETIDEVVELSKEISDSYLNYNYLINNYIEIESPLKVYLRNNALNPNLEIIKYLERFNPYGNLSSMISPLEEYLRANASNPNLEIIKRMENLLPFGSTSITSSPLEEYLRANASNPNLEIIKRMENQCYESSLNSPLEKYLKTTNNPKIGNNKTI